LNQYPIEKLVQNIFKYSGVLIRNPERISDAFIHKSVLNENPDYTGSYERLEFLGDAVLELVISDYLYNDFGIEDEGELTIKRSVIVRQSTLSNISENMNLEEFVVTGSGVNVLSGKERKSILADVFESLCGYIFLIEGYDQVKKFVLNCLKNEIHNLNSYNNFKDPKSLLQEKLQKIGEALPIYNTIKIISDDDDMIFETKVYVKDKLLACGKGKRKIFAEQKAAEIALNIVGRS
tara:strand:- start:5020 stop:5727 length:708 start_codon:yes stop_codon:yes gene_type:complete